MERRDLGPRHDLEIADLDAPVASRATETRQESAEKGGPAANAELTPAAVEGEHAADNDDESKYLQGWRMTCLTGA